MKAGRLFFLGGFNLKYPNIFNIWQNFERKLYQLKSINAALEDRSNVN